MRIARRFARAFHPVWGDRRGSTDLGDERPSDPPKSALDLCKARHGGGEIGVVLGENQGVYVLCGHKHIADLGAFRDWRRLWFERNFCAVKAHCNAPDLRQGSCLTGTPTHGVGEGFDLCGS